MVAKLYIKLLLFALPLLIVVLAFFIGDPFGIFYNKQPLVETSGDAGDFKAFDDMNPAQHYNAFIFGNSRTLAFTSKNWQQYVPAQNSFCFGAPGECIFNINKKLHYISDHGNPINYALVLLDWEMIGNYRNTGKNMQGPVYLHHPKSSTNSYLNYYLGYFKFYFNNYFYAKYLYFAATHHYKAWMKDAFDAPTQSKVEATAAENIHHEMDYTELENEMSRDFAGYYKTHHFAKAALHNDPKSIHEGDMETLREMKHLFEEQHTDYRIVISPNYYHQPLRPAIVDSLRTVFGDHLYDFSASELSGADTTFYIEPAHYNSRLGNLIMAAIYQKR